MNQKELKKLILETGKTRSLIKKEELLDWGATETNIAKLLNSGILRPSTSRFYKPANAKLTRDRTEVEVSFKFPKTILCLATALSFHELTTQSPYQVWVSMPNGFPPPRDQELPIRTIHMPPEVYNQGIETSVEKI